MASGSQLRLRLQNSTNGAHQLERPSLVSCQLLLPESRELAESCALFAFGQFPFGLYAFLPFKTMQSWV
jgi:hypothetical protein